MIGNNMGYMWVISNLVSRNFWGKISNLENFTRIVNVPYCGGREKQGSKVLILMSI